LMDHKPNPYVGPRSFERKDGDLFFGREREVREILSLIIAHREVLVYAPSGAGRAIPKSLKEEGEKRTSICYHL
ncbi:MAG: hypothetical protein JSV68_05595, partial [Anaerolineaceae bacterium]